MKVAICFSGVLRTFEECWPSYQRILSKYDCDLFVATTPGTVLHNYPFKKVLYQVDEWIDEGDLNQNKNSETIVQNTLRQFYFIKLANDLQKSYAKEKGIKYEWIIRTRLDNIIVNDLPNLHELDPSKIYIPEGHDHPMAWIGEGINDRFAFGGEYPMTIYCDKACFIDHYMRESKKRFHPETILKWFLDHRGINIQRCHEVSKINRGNNELL